MVSRRSKAKPEIHAESGFCLQCREPYRLCTERNSRSRPVSDFAWHAEKVVVEILGGTFARLASKYNTGSGLHTLLRKTNLAQLAGWVALKFDAKQISSGEALAVTQDALKERRRVTHDR